MEYATSPDGSVPVVFCERQKRWLPMQGHLDCEYCAAPVFDYEDEPVSFLCTYHGDKREFQIEEEPPPGWVEDGRGPPTYRTYRAWLDRSD